jgi:ATP synthase protein I
MEEYYRLQQNLLLVTLDFSGIIFAVCLVGLFSRSIALNYLIGACTGVVYLRMLAKNVANLGRGQSKISSGRLPCLLA